MREVMLSAARDKASLRIRTQLKAHCFTNSKMEYEINFWNKEFLLLILQDEKEAVEAKEELEERKKEGVVEHCLKVESVQKQDSKLPH